MTPTRFPIVLLRPLGQLSVKCESQYTRGIAKCKQKSWHFLKRSAALGVAVGFEVPKNGFRPAWLITQLFKRGIHERLGNEFKNLWVVLWTTGMHFATTALCPLTCGLAQLVPAASYLVHKSVKLLVGIWLECA